MPPSPLPLFLQPCAQAVTHSCRQEAPARHIIIIIFLSAVYAHAWKLNKLVGLLDWLSLNNVSTHMSCSCVEYMVWVPVTLPIQLNGPFWLSMLIYFKFETLTLMYVLFPYSISAFCHNIIGPATVTSKFVLKSISVLYWYTNITTLDGLHIKTQYRPKHLIGMTVFKQFFKNIWLIWHCFWSLKWIFKMCKALKYLLHKKQHHEDRKAEENSFIALRMPLLWLIRLTILIMESVRPKQSRISKWF